MKVGSLVKCIREFSSDGAMIIARWGASLPTKDKIYTVRDIESNSEGNFIRLEEIVNPKFQFKTGFLEPNFNSDCFRELLPPMQIDLEEILEKELVK